MDEFGVEGLISFEDRFVDHVRTNLPRHYEELGDDAVRRFVRKGIEHSPQYEIVEGPDIARYINLMLILGADFDENPNLDWVRDILIDKSIPTANEKLDLVMATLQFLCQQGEAEAAGSSESPG